MPAHTAHVLPNTVIEGHRGKQCDRSEQKDSVHLRFASAS